MEKTCKKLASLLLEFDKGRTNEHDACVRLLDALATYLRHAHRGVSTTFYLEDERVRGGK